MTIQIAAQAIGHNDRALVLNARDSMMYIADAHSLGTDHLTGLVLVGKSNTAHFDYVSQNPDKVIARKDVEPAARVSEVRS